MVAALAVGISALRRGLAVRAVLLLVKGFGLAIVAVLIVGLLARWAGWISIDDVTGPRPLTGFIWRPDRWSGVVAVLAGCAGVLSQTAGRSNALVGVFISVTTVPAAGDFVLALALGAPGQLGGAAAQLGINLLGMTIAGVLTLVIQRTPWRLIRTRTGHAAETLPDQKPRTRRQPVMRRIARWFPAPSTSITSRIAAQPRRTSTTCLERLGDGRRGG